MCNRIEIQKGCALARDIKRKSIQLTLLGLSAVYVLGTGMIANAQPQGSAIELSVQAQSLGDALFEISDAFGITVFADNALIEGKYSTPVVGVMQLGAALEMTLSGSGLIAEQQSNGAYIIVAQADETPPDGVEQSVVVESNLDPEPLIAEPIIVTGQKFERSLQNTKESVAVITNEIAQERTLLSFQDAALQVPNIAAVESNGTRVTIRGVSPTAGNAGSVGGTGEVSIVLYDNVPFLGEGRIFVPDNNWDVEQIEYLRGPQSTNVGRNALAGAVVIRSAKPELGVLDAATRLEYGNFDTYSVEGMVNIPVTDTIALRLSAEHSETDGFIENEILGDQFGDDSLNLRGRLLFEPNSKFSALASLQYQDFRTRGGEVTIQDGDELESFTATNNVLGEFTFEGVFSSLELNYDLSDRWEFASITSFIDGQYGRLTDADRAALDTGTVGEAADEQTFTQEVRFTYSSDRLRGMLGGFYLDFDSEFDQTGSIFIRRGGLAAQGVPAPILSFYPDPIIAVTTSDVTGTVTNTAFFTQWEYDLTEKLQISAGFRYDYEEIEQTNVGGGFLDPSTPLPDPAIAGQLSEAQQPGSGALVSGGVALTNMRISSFLVGGEEMFDADYEAFLPEFGVTYALTPRTDLSAFYKRGYRAGGAEVLLGGSVNTFDPEYLDNFELALRSSLLNGDLIFNANAYYGLWTDQQVRVPFNGDPNVLVNLNLGESQISGFELQSDYIVSDDTSVFASLGFANTEFTDTCRIGSVFADLPDCEIDGAAGKDLAGNQFPNAPEWTIAAGVRHSFAENWFGQINATYQDNRFSDVENNPEFKNDSFALLNASAGYEGDRFSITIYGRNLTDEFATTSIIRDFANDLTRIFPIRPRTYGVIVSAKF